MAETQLAIDAGQYRQVLGQYPTGVCVVTSLDAHGAPVGMVVGSFTSVSLDPPLVGFFPDRGSSSWRRLSESDRFCVNILSADQENICRKLASKDADKFTAITYRSSPLGSPIIDGVVAWIDCQLHSLSEAGDHLVVFGEVKGLEVADGGLPLLFFQGGYGRFAPSSLAASDRHGQLTVQLRLVDRARAQMEALAEELAAVCVASARIADEVVIIASAGQPPPHSPATLVGQRLPFLPPTGSVFAAWMEDEAVRAWATKHAAGDRLEFVLKSLATVRERGYSVGLTNDAQRAFVAKLQNLAAQNPDELPSDLGEMVRELSYDPAELDEATSMAVRLISAPVFDETGTVAFALTLHSFARPSSKVQVEQIADRLLETTQAISKALGSNR